MKKWYHEGLKFECTACGKCCTGAPGYVWLTLEEMQVIACFLDMDFLVFKQCYTRKVDGRYCLKEDKSRNWSCVFLRDSKC